MTDDAGADTPEDKPATGSIRFSTGFHSLELQGLELPVEVRTRDLRVVARVMSSQVADGLRPGPYVVLSRLPGGQEILQEVFVGSKPENQAVVEIAPSEADRSPQEGHELSLYMGDPARTALDPPAPAVPPRLAAPVALTEGLVAGEMAGTAPPPALETLGAAPPASGAAPDFTTVLLEEFARFPAGGSDARGGVRPVTPVPAPPAPLPAVPLSPAPFVDAFEVQLALFCGNALRLGSEQVREGVIWRDLVTGRSARLRIEGAAAISTLQVLQPHRPPLHIALPVSPGKGCIVEIGRAPEGSGAEADALSIDTHVENADADALLRYLSTGRLQNIETALAGTTETAQELLSGSFADPVAAVVGGYVLLRFNRLERLGRENWSQSFFDNVGWLPDSAVIHGEHLARRGLHAQALDVFLTLAERGLPVSTAGLSYVVDRLDLYTRLTDGSLDAGKQRAAQSLSLLLDGYRRTALYQRQLLTFPGQSPNLPSNAAPAGLRRDEAARGLLSLRFDKDGVTPGPAAEAPVRPDAGAGATGPTGQAPTPTLPPEVLVGTERRFRERQTPREEQLQRLDRARASGDGPRALLSVNDPAMVALRSRHVLTQPMVQDAMAEAGLSPLETLGPIEGVVLERILGGDNLLGTAFLKLGTLVARTVGRVVIGNRVGATLGYGTGCLVSPRLFMTNNHVLPSARVAAMSRIEFDYERGLDGQPLASSLFSLQPDAFFVTDETLDVTIVAVAGTSDDGRTPLGRFGFNRLVRDAGKILIGESVNIIQHPDGRPKQVALQQNELIDRLDLFLHYRTDTAPGSSGSPLFNNQWEMIGLHHSGVPERDDENRILTRDGRVWTAEMGESAIRWIANEGARISSILAFIQGVPNLTPEQQALRDEVLNPPLIAPMETPAAPPPSPAPGTLAPLDHPAEAVGPAARPATGTPCGALTLGQVTLTLPIRISVELETPGIAAAPAALPTAMAMAQERLTLQKPVIDHDYASRRGYDPGFLGSDLPLPDLVDPGMAAPTADGDRILRYEHFSIVMHKARRLALFTAANVDWREDSRRPEPGRDYSRSGLTGIGPNRIEEWVTDSRLSEAHQLPDVFYSSDRGAFDKGHVVRRGDVCWGASYEQVRRANGDTFHVTNCAPQVAGYNQSAKGEGNWGDLENFVRMQTQSETCCIFAGPVFRDTDRRFRGHDTEGPVLVQIPRSFWKLVVTRKAGGLEAFAFVLEQDLDAVPLETAQAAGIADAQALEFAPTPEWRRRMLSLRDLEGRLCLLRFPEALHQADQHARPDGLSVARFARLDP